MDAEASAGSFQWPHKQRGRVTEKLMRLLVDRIFAHVIYQEKIQTCAQAKCAMKHVLVHHFPIDAHHSQCKQFNHRWCKTAFEGRKNQSSVLGTQYPIGIGADFEIIFFEKVFTPGIIDVLLMHGSTSLNEAANNVIMRFVGKKRNLGPKAFLGAVARGVCQWNNPYVHVLQELERFGCDIADEHMQTIYVLAAKIETNRNRSKSHDQRLRKYQRKWKLTGAYEECEYVGNMDGFFMNMDGLSNESQCAMEMDGETDEDTDIQSPDILPPGRRTSARLRKKAIQAAQQ